MFLLKNQKRKSKNIKMENSKIYKASGEIIDIYPENNKNFSLTELQNIVGGYIEIILTNKPGYL